MKQSNRLLDTAAQKLDLPPDIVAGQSRLELMGFGQCSLEPHKGLLEYSRELISVDTLSGKVDIIGKQLDIVQMNRDRITVRGDISGIMLMENCHE